jgi:HSP20 family molecular chaperone IbpA
VSRVSVFSSPLLLGFDQLERMLDNVSKASADGYPPYNIEQISPNEIRISLAVAGFTESDLDVAVEGNELIVRGRQVEDDEGRVFLHRGIAARQFQRRFVIAEGIEVEGALLEHGLLQIHLVRPESVVRSRSIAIQTGGPARSNGRSVSV